MKARRTNSRSLTTLGNQRVFMDNLFQKLKFQTLDEWLTTPFPKRILVNNKGTVLNIYYSHDIQKLLSTIYPNYPWNFEIMKEHILDFSKTEKQRQYMDGLFKEYNLKHLKDFAFFAKKNLNKRLYEIYEGDFEKLLRAIYPNYPWDSERIRFGSNSYFKPLENQRAFMSRLFTEFGLAYLQDWQKVTINRIKQTNIGEHMARVIYSNSMEKLCTTIYPNFPWNFQEYEKLPRNYFKEMENQREFMEELFKKYELEYLRDFIIFSKNKIVSNQGSLLLQIYNYDIIALLTSVYPNYPWSGEFEFSSAKYFASEENQVEFMRSLFVKYNLVTFEDWLNIPKFRIIENGGITLLSQYYYHDLERLLSSVFPNFPWKEIRQEKLQKGDWKNNIQAHRLFMDQLYYKLKLRSLDRWTSVPKIRIFDNEGHKILYCYGFSMKKLLSSVYPNFPWDNLTTPRIVSTPEIQRSFMEKLFNTLHLTSFDDWPSVAKIKFVENAGGSLLQHYNRDLKLLLCSIYPNFPWNFLKFKPSLVTFFQQRRFMNALFDSLQLQSFDDWYSISKKKILKNGGGVILSRHGNDLFTLFSFIYPNFPWKSFPHKVYSVKYFRKALHYQRRFMEKLFVTLNMSTLDDWLHVSRKTMLELGAQSLLSIYSNDMYQLLTSIYPNYTWDFGDFVNPKLHPKLTPEIIANQRRCLNFLFLRFNLSYLDDWLRFPKFHLANNNAIGLYRYYNFDMRRLLTSVYPNFPWCFGEVRISPSRQFQYLENQREFMNALFLKLKLSNLSDWLYITKSKFYRVGVGYLLRRYSNDISLMLHSIYPNFPFNLCLGYKVRRKIISLITKYCVLKKEHWYRVPYEAFKTVRPWLGEFESWEHQLLISKNKKCEQRIVFATLQRILHSHHIFENYKLMLVMPHQYPLEFDVFIPALNLSVEYQGMQHFEEIPSQFNYLRCYEVSDQMKIEHAKNSSITLLHIPYWWDNSIASLQYFVYTQFCHNISPSL